RLTVAADFGIAIGSEMTSALRDSLLEEDDFLSAYEYAIDLLARRARSEREVRDRLRRKRYEEPAISRVLNRLVENNYLDDAEFARFWIENRTANRPKGDRALRQELMAKGVNRPIIDEALSTADLDQRMLAIEAGRKRIRSLEGLPPDVQRRRLASYLQRRGFRWDAIGPAMETILGTSGDVEEADNE
ncbi:MAG: regulatory protein RecX, partial [Thermomicrobiales bacterium]